MHAQSRMSESGGYVIAVAMAVPSAAALLSLLRNFI